MKVTLTTREGEFLATVHLPPFHPPPACLAWGNRIFTWQAWADKAATVPIYVEGTAAVLPEPA